MDEGLALYAEEARTLQAAVLRRALLPLDALAAELDGEEAHIRLAQAEALRPVTFLMQTHGPTKLAALLATYRAGLPSAQAYPAALGTSPGAFEEAWLIWLGVPKAWRGRAPW